MARAWHLMQRPQGMPVPDNFAIKDFDLPELGEGMVRVANRWLSVDPYMRGRMKDVKSYVPPFELNAPMTGGAIGEVVESRDPSLAAGDMVLHMSGWRDETVEPAANFNKLPAIPGVEPQAFLGNLGLTGGTAYFGLLEAASAKEGDIVIEFDGVPSRTTDEFSARVRRAVPYNTIKLVVMRGTEKIEIPVKMGKQ